MPTFLPPASAAAANFTPYLIRVDLDVTNCRELARSLRHSHPVRRPRLLIDCHSLRCLRTQGVAHCASQLLTLHAVGAQILLLNVPPVLGRCLELLRLKELFQISTLAAAPLAAAA